MRYAHIYSRLVSTPWFIDEATLSAISRLVESRINGLPADCPAPLGDPPDPAEPPELPEPPGTTIICLSGVIGKHLSSMEILCGGVDMDVVRRQFDAAQSDPTVAQVILAIDSPGGTAIGNHELFQHMLATKTKPLIAYTDTIMGSAAYYLGAAADWICAAPTARIGSVGSYMVVCDESQKMQREGVSLRVIRSGAYKGMGIDAPLTPDQLALLQADIDYLGAQFRADMTTARPQLQAADMQGLAYFGEQALAKGFIDELVPDLNTLIQRLAVDIPA